MTDNAYTRRFLKDLPKPVEDEPIFDIKPDDEMPVVTEVVVDELKGKDD